MPDNSQIRGRRATMIIVDEFFSPPCGCGAPAVGGQPVCVACAHELRELTHPSSKDAVLHLIADIGEGSTSLNSLSHIARLARHGLTLED